MQISNMPLIGSFFNYFQLKDFIDYQPRIQLSIETPHFSLKTADSFHEIYSSFLLRGKVFKKSFINIDFDKFDLTFDHLIVKDKKKNKIIGTYRLNSSQFNDVTYAADEFDLSYFLSLPGNKLELGRACIHHNYRNGRVIDLLWKGIFQYATKTNTQFLFGCTSIKSTNIDHLCSVSHFFEEKKIFNNKYKIVPRNNFSFDQFYREYREKNKEPKKTDIPPLLKSYLFSGAEVCGHPFFDYDFKCSDYLTILDMNKVNRLFKKRYLQER